MIALIAGTGSLPKLIAQAWDENLLVCELEGIVSEVPAHLPKLQFRIETLGSFLEELKRRGATKICMAGAIPRPQVDPAKIDAKTLPLVPRIQAAISKGDDGALREIIAIFEDTRFEVIGASDLLPALLPAVGCPTQTKPKTDLSLQIVRDAFTTMSARDVGQSCIVKDGRIIALEGQDGTAAMIEAFGTAGAILFKGPKRAQELRADMPVIGPDTVKQIRAKNMAGIVIAYRSVMVLGLQEVITALDAADAFLWIGEGFL